MWGLLFERRKKKQKRLSPLRPAGPMCQDWRSGLDCEGRVTEPLQTRSRVSSWTGSLAMLNWGPRARAYENWKEARARPFPTGKTKLALNQTEPKRSTIPSWETKGWCSAELDQGLDLSQLGNPGPSFAELEPRARPFPIGNPGLALNGPGPVARPFPTGKTKLSLNQARPRGSTFPGWKPRARAERKRNQGLDLSHSQLGKQSSRSTELEPRA